jgi:hemolysin type calcium-binding protein
VRGAGVNLVVVALTAVVVVSQAAEAAVVTTTFELPADPRQGISGLFAFAAAPGERNAVTLRGDGVDILVSDSTTALQAGSGCHPEGTGVVRCPWAGMARSDVELGDGDDAVTVVGELGEFSVNVRGGPGDDVMIGGSDGEDFSGGPGVDVLDGGDGNDRFVDDDPDEQPSADRYDGGQGDDSLSFYGRVRPLRLDLGAGTTADGDVLAGIERATGGEGADVLAGSDGPDVLWGTGGKDIMVGRAGDDELHGGPAADGLDGGEGNDSIEGGSGRDHLSGGGGADRLDPSLAGRETRGEDQDPAGPRPPAGDQVDCGDGPDTVAFPEPVDAVRSDCELLIAFTSPRLASFEVPLHPSRAPSTDALIYVVRMFSATSLMPVRLEVLNSRGRQIGSSRRVRLRALRPEESGTPIRVQLKRGVVIGRAPVGWHVRVRAWHRRSASVLTLPTRP